MSHARQTLLVALVALIIPATAGAVTIHVPSGQPTIQEGINAAGEGDTVLVAPDTYTGPLNRDLDFGGTSLSLVSESGQGYTIIACDKLGRGFFFHSGEDTTSVVRGFTIASAVADTGAGAYCVNGSSPRFEECTFTDNTAQKRGGGLCCNASSPVVRDCEFSQNVAWEGTGYDGRGGGVACFSGSSPLIVDTDFMGNNARYSGGGLHSHSSSPQLVRCDFLGNLIAAYADGAGAWLYNADGATLTECRFQENGVSTCAGGGMYVISSTITVADCDFIDNISGSSGGMRMTLGGTSTLTGCTFIGNTGAFSTAGAVQCGSDANPTFSNCTFVGNGTFHVMCNGASPTLEYCILAFSSDGAPVYCDEGTETPSIHHCLVFGNADGDSLCGGNYHDIEYVDPLLCDWEHDDVTLCADSPCLPGATGFRS